MEPDFSSYSKLELEDSLRIIDKEKYPDRVLIIKEELLLRQGNIVKVEDEYEYEVIDSSGSLNKCPSCNNKIGVFSKARNVFSKVKACPHCNEPFVEKMNYKKYFLLLVPAIILYIFIMRPLVIYIGLSKYVAVPIIYFLLTFITTELRKVKVKQTIE